MSSSRRLTILITGCSPGGTGAALAEVFHRAGHHVYATGRNADKLAPLAAQGLVTLALDVTSAASIAAAVEAVAAKLPAGRGLDMLVNNAAGSYSMPAADVALDEARALFDLNVWAQLAVTQAFLPLLLRAAEGEGAPATSGPPPLVVNHTSVGSVTALPFQGVYNASKAAFAMLSATLRLELAPFGVRVVELKTGGVRTNLIANNAFNARAATLPADSIYAPARAVVEKALSQEGLAGVGIAAEQWADEVAALLLRARPPTVIWKGESAFAARVAAALPLNLFEGMLKKITKLDVVEQIIQESRK